MRIEIVRKWLNDEIAKQKANQGRLAEHIGIAGGELSRFLSGKRENLTIDQIFRASEFLQVGFPEELFADKKLYVKKAPLRGTIAAGILRAKDMEPPNSISSIPYLPTELFGDFEQYAFQLADDSAEDYAPPQAFVIFVDFNKARKSPEDGDVVRIEQTYLISGRRMTQEVTEASLKRIKVNGSRVILRSLQSRKADVPDIEYDPSDTALVIRDLAIGYYVMTADKPRQI